MTLKKLAGVYLKPLKLLSSDKSRHALNHQGIAQLALLLSLAPFIFDLHLYGGSQVQEKPSIYEFDPHRFETLPPFPELANAPKRPRAPKPLTVNERSLLQNCKSAPPWFLKKICSQVIGKNKRYQIDRKEYAIAKKAHAKAYQKYLRSVKNREKADQEYQSFELTLKAKPSLPEPEIKEKTNISFASIVSSSIALDSWQVTGTILWLVGLLLLGPAMFFCVKGRAWGLLLFGLAVPAYNYGVLLLSYVSGLEKLSGLYLNSVLVAQVAFFWFVVFGHIRSKAFALFLLLMSVSVTIAVFVGDSTHSVFKANLPIVIFLLVSCLLRLAVVAVLDNWRLFNAASPSWARLRENVFIFSHSIALWLPLGAVTIAVYYVSSFVLPTKVINQLERSEILMYGSDHDVLDNALQSAALKVDDGIYAWHLSTESIKLDIYKKSEALQKKSLSAYVVESFDDIMPARLEFGPYESDAIIGVKQAAEIAVDASQKSTKKAYEKLREKMRRALLQVASSHEKEFDRHLSSNTAKVLSVVDDMHQDGINQILTLNVASQRSIWWTINTLRAIKMIATVIFVFICIKSILYVFSRLRFNRRSGLFITLGSLDSSAETIESEITATGLQYCINSKDEAVYFISRRFQCRGMAPRFTIPSPSSACFSRLANKSWSMNKITVFPGEDPVKCTATKGIEFFEWNLKSGEQVVFDFHNFVGMTAGVTFSTLLSARLSSLLFGKLFYSVATGPGKLILMAEGRAEVSEEGSLGGSFPPERIIACDINSRFQVDSVNDILNIYVSPAYIRPEGQSKVIVDVDSLRGVRTGLGSFIKRLMLPV